MSNRSLLITGSAVRVRLGEPKSTGYALFSAARQSISRALSTILWLAALLLTALPAQVFAQTITHTITVWYIGDDPETPDANEADYYREFFVEGPEITEQLKFCGGQIQPYGLITTPLGRWYFFQRSTFGGSNNYYVLDWEKDRLFHGGFGDCTSDGTVSE